MNLKQSEWNMAAAKTFKDLSDTNPTFELIDFLLLVILKLPPPVASCE